MAETFSFQIYRLCIKILEALEGLAEDFLLRVGRFFGGQNQVACLNPLARLCVFDFLCTGQLLVNLCLIDLMAGMEKNLKSLELKRRTRLGQVILKFAKQWPLEAVAKHIKYNTLRRGLETFLETAKTTDWTFKTPFSNTLSNLTSSDK